MSRLILIYCLLGGVVGQEYGIPVAGVSSEVYNQAQNEGQIPNQAQNQGQIQNQDGQANVLQPPPQGPTLGLGNPEQPYPAGAIQQEDLPYQGPSDNQQEQEAPQQLPQPEQDAIQLAEVPQLPAETYGLPPASDQGSDVSLEHPLDEERPVVQIAEFPSPPADPSEVYGLPPYRQSPPGPRQKYNTGATYQKQFQLNPSSQYQQGIYREGTQYQNYANKYKADNQYPYQYQKYTNQYKTNINDQYQHRGQYQQNPNQYRPVDQYQKDSQYQGQQRQEIKYPHQYQSYNQGQKIVQHLKNQRLQQPVYLGSNVYPQSQDLRRNQNFNQNPKYTSQHRQGSQYHQNPNQYQQTDQRQQHPSQYRYGQPSGHNEQSYPGAQSGQGISSQFESSNYIKPNLNDFSTSTIGTRVSTHLSRGFPDVQTSQLPVRYILLFQRNQAEGEPELSSVSYLSHPILQRSKIQEVHSLPILVEPDEVPIVLPVPHTFQRGSSYGSASSTFVSKDSPGEDQQQGGFRNDAEQQVGSADVSSQLTPSQPQTSYRLPYL